LVENNFQPDAMKGALGGDPHRDMNFYHKYQMLAGYGGGGMIGFLYSRGPASADVQGAACS